MTSLFCKPRSPLGDYSARGEDGEISKVLVRSKAGETYWNEPAFFCACDGVSETSFSSTSLSYCNDMHEYMRNGKGRQARTLFVMEWTGEPRRRRGDGYGRLQLLYSSDYVMFTRFPSTSISAPMTLDLDIVVRNGKTTVDPCCSSCRTDRVLLSAACTAHKRHT